MLVIVKLEIKGYLRIPVHMDELIFDGTAKTKLAKLAFLHCREFVPSFQLQENLGEYISSNITLAWDHVGFFCHSSGCEEFLTLFETFEDPTFAKVK